MHRRRLLNLLAAAPFLGAERALAQAAGRKTLGAADIAELQRNWRAFLPPGAPAPAPGDALKLGREEWKKRLSPAAFHVLREEGTERAGSSPLDREKRAGLFVCAGCDLPLFTSPMKYDSGTGWPSFFTTIADVFGTKTDYKLLYPRTEYHCLRCGGHHGHVFRDGPAPTGLRYCNNGVALKFLPREPA